MITKNETVVKIDSCLTSGLCKILITSKNKIKRADFVVVERKTGRKFHFSFVGNDCKVDSEFQIENPTLWYIYDPALYDYDLSIENDNGSEKINGTFGIRELTTNGKNVCLNGRPIFVRGYIRGIKAHDHLNNCNLPIKEFYRKNILQAKKFGFNFVRFHSTIPSEEFFQMADELGILVHIELRPENDEYNNLEEMLTTKMDFGSDEFITSVVERLYNHPSLAVYCIGNEIKGLNGEERSKQIGALIKKLDGSRLFLDTCAWGANNREGVDLDVQHMSYYFPFGKHAGMYDDTRNLLVCGSAGGESLSNKCNNSTVTRTLFFNVPLIAHEVCHYTALRDFKSLKEKFNRYGVKEPWWIDEELKMINAKGFADKYDKMYKASKDFQLECWKIAFEEMRSSSLLGGFQMLQFTDTDYYENSNGVVDCFDDVNYITPERFLIFNGDEVLLTKLGGRIFFENEQLDLPIILSNYGEKNDKFANFSYSLEDDNGNVVVSGKMDNINVARRGNYEICKVKFVMPQVAGSKKFIFKVKLENANGLYSFNQWNIWVYEKVSPISYKEFVCYEKGNSVITDNFDKAFEMLSKGKNVCLVYRSDWTRHLTNKSMQNPKYAFKATWNRFKPVIWDRGTNYGGLCDSALLNKFGFATSDFYDINYSVLTEDCDKISLDDFPVKVNSIIAGIDKNVRDRFDAYAVGFNLPELQYDRTLRDFSYLFGLKVGNGNLLVCGMNMTGLDKNEPSTLAMAQFIIKYLGSDVFEFDNQIDEKSLKEYLSKCAEKPVKERMMTQFWQLDDTPVESKQYWDESRAYLKD
ncbi:MAG: hypothetical protein IJA88_06585 [Clostridia bacterium]|nr:hypothetical protein [Clostridia bacterium]